MIPYVAIGRRAEERRSSAPAVPWGGPPFPPFPALPRRRASLPERIQSAVGSITSAVATRGVDHLGTVFDPGWGVLRSVS
ncbi:hypothetical protein RAJCM14343_5104 [Rhodococcus aetherivorans]|uniref:Uncharacterized protein n=1 Tax=Rhodococcus aetherivorans TaxID=191292 RepID=A0ABQ0YTT4_9NOCA|nr:hypothetical protein RAJCM14343_5104 [Rhodococcus aetherivorans]CCW11831.1 hypothetical protein EBESD8_23740 [Rhodococcus aetherivorans]